MVNAFEKQSWQCVFLKQTRKTIIPELQVCDSPIHLFYNRLYYLRDK